MIPALKSDIPDYHGIDLDLAPMRWAFWGLSVSFDIFWARLASKDRDYCKPWLEQCELVLKCHKAVADWLWSHIEDALHWREPGFMYYDILHKAAPELDAEVLQRSRNYWHRRDLHKDELIQHQDYV